MEQPVPRRSASDWKISLEILEQEEKDLKMDMVQFQREQVAYSVNILPVEFEGKRLSTPIEITELMETYSKEHEVNVIEEMDDQGIDDCLKADPTKDHHCMVIMEKINYLEGILYKVWVREKKLKLLEADLATTQERLKGIEEDRRFIHERLAEIEHLPPATPSPPVLITTGNNTVIVNDPQAYQYRGSPNNVAIKRPRYNDEEEEEEAEPVRVEEFGSFIPMGHLDTSPLEPEDFEKIESELAALAYDHVEEPVEDQQAEEESSSVSSPSSPSSEESIVDESDRPLQPAPKLPPKKQRAAVNGKATKTKRVRRTKKEMQKDEVQPKRKDATFSLEEMDLVKSYGKQSSYEIPSEHLKTITGDERTFVNASSPEEEQKQMVEIIKKNRHLHLPGVLISVAPMTIDDEKTFRYLHLHRVLWPYTAIYTFRFPSAVYPIYVFKVPGLKPFCALCQIDMDYYGKYVYMNHYNLMKELNGEQLRSNPNVEYAGTLDCPDETVITYMKTNYFRSVNAVKHVKVVSKEPIDSPNKFKHYAVKYLVEVVYSKTAETSFKYQVIRYKFPNRLVDYCQTIEELHKVADSVPFIREKYGVYDDFRTYMKERVNK